MTYVLRMEPEPIVHELTLRCTAERAFDTYTARIGEWWNPDYTADAKTLRAVTIEPFVGGRVFATHDGREDLWGTVTVWEPGRRVAYLSTLAQDPVHPSEISVRFIETPGGCRVRFAHGGWNDTNAAHRAKFREWPKLLERFVALAEL